MIVYLRTISVEKNSVDVIEFLVIWGPDEK